MQLGRYHGQLLRYFELFPRDQLHVLLSGDIRRDPVGTVQGLYRFVGANPAFVPDFATAHNVGGVPASGLMERVFTNRTLRTALEPWMPRQAANWFRRLRARTMRQAPPLPPALRAELTSHFRDDILKTADLIGRTLNHWL
jgi:hypothetical protein